MHGLTNLKCVNVILRFVVFDSGMMNDDCEIKMAFTPVTTCIFIKLLSKNCSNNLHYMMILKCSYKIRLYCNTFRWQPPPPSSGEVYFVS